MSDSDPRSVEELLRILQTDVPATGERVRFKAMPEAKGTVGPGVQGGKFSVVLDGTGHIVWVTSSEVERITNLEGEA